MIEQTEEGSLVSCDECSTELLLKTRNTEHVKNYLADHNWVFEWKNGQIHFRCPCCADHKSNAQTAPLRFPR